MAATADPWLLAADLLDPPPEPTSGDLAECKADVTVFIERHASIEDPDGTVVPFTLWPFQHEPLQALQAGESIIVLKARRLGLSWVVLAFALWRAIFQQGIRILILCKNEDDATELLDRIRRMKQRISENPDSAHILAGLRQPRRQDPRRRLIHHSRPRRHAGRGPLRDRRPGHRRRVRVPEAIRTNLARTPADH